MHSLWASPGFSSLTVGNQEGMQGGVRGIHLVSPQKPSRQEESEQKIQTPERPKARTPPKLSNFVY